MSIEKSEFQKKFLINEEAYTGQEIREAIKNSFPYKNGIYQGLSRITHKSAPFHSDKILNLEILIPDIENIEKLPVNLPTNFCYGVIEGTPRKARPITSTFFIPTDIGYICDEMIFDNNEIHIYNEQELKNFELYKIFY